jgi:hypothetical protein
VTKLEPPRLRYLGKIAGLPTYLVSGEKIRNEIDIDFTCGGNESVYPTYVPPGEIWIDDGLKVFDQMATALHEIVERDQMIRFGKSYDDAHEVASANERPFRRELARERPTKFDARRVGAAYAAYRRSPYRHPVIDRPDDLPRSPQQMENDIAEALRDRRRGP